MSSSRHLALAPAAALVALCCLCLAAPARGDGLPGRYLLQARPAGRQRREGRERQPGPAALHGTLDLHNTCRCPKSLVVFQVPTNCSSLGDSWTHQAFNCSIPPSYTATCTVASPPAPADTVQCQAGLGGERGQVDRTACLRQQAKRMPPGKRHRCPGRLARTVLVPSGLPSSPAFLPMHSLRSAGMAGHGQRTDEHLLTSHPAGRPPPPPNAGGQ